jgi:hypothetical protein
VHAPPQVAPKEGEVALKDKDVLPEYVLCFRPPLIIRNVLPFRVTLTLHDNKPGADPRAEPLIFTLEAGATEEVYQFDMNSKIKMTLQMQVTLLCIHSGTSSPVVVVVIRYAPASLVAKPLNQ